MNQEQLVKKIRYSLQEGYTEEEIKKVLRDQGMKHSKINKALQQAQQGQQNSRKSQTDREKSSQPERSVQKQEQKSKPAEQDVRGNPGSEAFGGQVESGSKGFSGQKGTTFGLTGDSFKVQQGFILSRYNVFDGSGDKVLKAKSKIFSIGADIPFKDVESGETVFRVKSKKLLNTSNNYVLRDEKKDEKIAVLDRKRTLISQVWKVRDPSDGAIVAKIESANKIVQALRRYGGFIPLIPNFFTLIPHSYVIKNANGDNLGRMDGKFSLKDTYKVKLNDSGQLPRESMVAAIIAVDALEGN
ncbi:MAG: hypothetical protein ABEJ93_03855 [Candidatus Nanohalobium sp.]